MDASADHGSGRARRLPAKVLLLAAILATGAVLFFVAWLRGWVSPAAIRSWVESAGPWAMAVYVVAVVLGQLLWMPRLWGLIAAGLLFGPLAGGLLALGADLISAGLAFGLARALARDWVREQLGRHPSAEAIVRVLAERQGAWTVAVLRICPIAHYTLVSLAAGMAGVRAGPFFLGTIIGDLPGAALYPLVGSSLSDPTGPVFLGAMLVVLVALVATLRLGRRWIRDARAEPPRDWRKP